MTTLRGLLQRSLPLPVYHVLRTTDHLGRLALNRPDPGWDFYSFEQSFHPDIRGKRHTERAAWAQRLADRANERSGEEPAMRCGDPVAQQGSSLRAATLSRFQGVLAWQGLRVMVHIPEAAQSPGVWSAFTNVAECLSFMGATTHVFVPGGNLRNDLNCFQPSIFLTGDHCIFTETCDWAAVDSYRKKHQVIVGVFSGPEPGGLRFSLESSRWAQSVAADFLFTFRDPSYVRSSPIYAPFLDAGFKFMHVPFGANVLHYHAEPGIERDVPFAFLASQNPSKFERYRRYAGPILRSHPGFVDGPGWRHARNFQFCRDRDRYIYARAKVGLNIHLEEQIDTPCEVNERTFQLAACGIPQVIDNPAMLSSFFSSDAMFIATTPREYVDCFDRALNDAEAALSRALKAQQEVFSRHTTFHRVLDFIAQLRHAKLLPQAARENESQGEPA